MGSMISAIILVVGSLGVSAVVSPSDYKSAGVFEQMGALMEANGESLVKEVDGIFAFKVYHKEWPSSTNEDGQGVEEATWILDAKNGKGGVKIKGEEEEEEKDDADVTFTATDSDLYDILTGEQDATQAYFGGKLTIDGSLMLAMKLSKFQRAPEPEHDEM